MSKRKLQAIGYEKDFVDFEDDDAYRLFVCDIEQRFLRKKDETWVHELLSKEKAEDWNEMLKAYFAECGFTTYTTRVAAADSLLNCVVEKMFEENDTAQRLSGEEYTKLTKPKVDTTTNITEFKQLTTELCKILKITPHPDPMVSLEAACIYINKYLNQDYIKERNVEVKEGKSVKTFDFKSFPTGLPNFPVGVVNIAARIVRLLNIGTIRDTQTHVNQTLVTIQNMASE